jgi:hypothetical protein
MRSDAVAAASLDISHPEVWKRRRAVVALVIGALAALTFSPVLRFGFVEWDDFWTLVSNADYRGLSWSHLHWMLTSIRGGHWMPVTWLSFGIDHALWGTNPLGYHLTNVLLHGANAVVFFFLARRLLDLAMPGLPAAAVHAGAATAALSFALHPLRVESVAWITERRDVLCALFWLVAVLAYVRAPERSGKKAGAWKLLSLMSFNLAVMAKSMAVTLPVVLLVLDVYPLRRHATCPRRLLLEKAPYLPMMLFGIFLALFAGQRDGALTSLDGLSILQRILVTSYGLWFYLSTTVVPLGLSPLYELPPVISAAAPRFIGAMVMVIAVTAGAFAARRRWPGLLAAWIVYAITLSPVSGLLHNGWQLVADRYSYLSCLPGAVLFGALVAFIATKLLTTPRPGSAWRVAAVACLLWILALPVLTWRQLPVWRNGETLWQYTLAVDPDCSLCHYYFGQYLRNRDRPALALEHFTRAADRRPALTSTALYRMHRGLAHIAVGDTRAAEQDLAAIRAIAPSLADDVSPAFITEW